jgi:hypothetical protein
MSQTRIAYLAALFSAASMVAACSGRASTMLPTGPTPVTGAAAASTASSDFGSGQFAPTAGRGQHFNGEGTVARLQGECPDLRMIVRGVVVTTDENTEFHDGACGNLRQGTKISVEVEQQDDGTFLALELTIVDQPGGTHVRGSGTVASLRGTCPNLTMVIHGFSVMTNADTTFEGVDCDDLHPGVKVEVSGDMVGSSVVMADTITLITESDE